MPRELVALSIPDLSDFAKRLRRGLSAAAAPPGHLVLLNMLARAAGYANFQQLRASPAAPAVPQAGPVGEKSLGRALRLFDAEGRMIRWPGRHSQQVLCLWVLWSRLPPDVPMSEREVNAMVDRWHLFGDRALLRRSLIGEGLAERRQDGSDYRRIGRTPPPEALALILALAEPRPNRTAGASR